MTKCLSAARDRGVPASSQPSPAPGQTIYRRVRSCKLFPGATVLSGGWWWREAAVCARPLTSLKDNRPPRCRSRCPRRWSSRRAARPSPRRPPPACRRAPPAPSPAWPRAPPCLQTLLTIGSLPVCFCFVPSQNWDRDQREKRKERINLFIFMKASKHNISKPSSSCSNIRELISALPWVALNWH